MPSHTKLHTKYIIPSPHRHNHDSDPRLLLHCKAGQCSPTTMIQANWLWRAWWSVERTETRANTYTHHHPQPDTEAAELTQLRRAASSERERLTHTESPREGESGHCLLAWRHPAPG
ncbi:hypothetical protein Pcinc_028457 [Petrolisthes cinctipes]|uniref:Uncharacterized protein n=1 Tax=Petrolisthes cinctipes TaxID=88211 RepID=A0AAE1K793_PETCI|nr:hypothetical protein Pcinc_028457 [Petrolisthes cinctipes]